MFTMQDKLKVQQKQSEPVAVRGDVEFLLKALIHRYNMLWVAELIAEVKT